jgi:hypothetical protein
MDWTADSNKAPTSNQTSRLQDLQAAMKNFFTTVAEATSDSNARIRYGFVPYSSSVNVGKLIRAANPDYMAENYTVQTRSWYKWGDANDTGTGSAYTAETLTSWNEGTRAYSKSSSCQSDIPTSSSWSDSGSPTNPGTTTWTIDAQGNRQNTTITKQQKQVKPQYECRKSGRNYYIYTQNVERFSQTFAYSEQKPVFITSPTETYNGLMYHEGTYNVSEYLKGNTVSTLTGTSNGAPALVSSTWGGCIEERKTKAESSFSYTVGEGITPTGALDLDIDSAPTADIASKWKPMWPEVAFNRGTDGPTTTGRAVTSACPAAAQLLTEMTEEDFDKYANSLTADGATYHDIGLIWGARLSSPTGIWKTNVNEEPDNGGAVSRHLIFMTDGALAPSNTNQSSYGIESRDKRVTGNGTSTLELTSRHRSRFLAVCEAIKGKGIRLWVISFATTLSEDLQTCASSNSSYSATDAKQLNDAFQKIAKQVGELRVTQ